MLRAAPIPYPPPCPPSRRRLPLPLSLPLRQPRRIAAAVAANATATAIAAAIAAPAALRLTHPRTHAPTPNTGRHHHAQQPPSCPPPAACPQQFNFCAKLQQVSNFLGARKPDLHDIMTGCTRWRANDHLASTQLMPLAPAPTSPTATVRQKNKCRNAAGGAVHPSPVDK